MAQALEWAEWSGNAEALNLLEREFLLASKEHAEHEAAEHETQRQRELEDAKRIAEAAQKLVETGKARAEEQIQYVARMRTRNRMIAAVGVVALTLAVLANIFGLQANQNAARAEQEARLATSRELASASIANLTVDPELSILLAIESVSQTYAINQTALPEAEDALHRAVGASRVQFTLSDPAYVGRVVFSPDSKRLAAAGRDGTTKILDVATGQPLLTIPDGLVLTEQGTWAADIAFSQDGTQLATLHQKSRSSATVAVNIWDTASGNLLKTTTLSSKDSKIVTYVAISPDWTRVVVGTAGLADVISKVYDLTTGEELFALGGHLYSIRALTFSPDGTRIATSSWDETTKVWDAVTGKALLTFSGPLVDDVAFSPDSALLAAAGEDGTTKIWDAVTGREIRTVFGHSNTVTGVQFSPDGKRLVTVSWDRKAIVWEISTGQELFTLYGHTNFILDVAFSPDGMHLATASDDKTVKVWDASPGGELPTLSFDKFPGLAFNSDQTRIAIVRPDATAEIRDIATGKLLLALSDPLGIRTLAFSPDSTRLATTDFGNETMSVWDAVTGNRLLTLTDLNVGDATFNPDGTRIVSVHGNGTAKIWEAATGKELPTLAGHVTPVWTAAYNLDGSRIVSLAFDGTIIVWDATTGQELLRLLHSNAGIPKGLAFSPDGKRFVTGSQDGTAKVWDLATGELLFTLIGHTSTVYRIAYSPDGTQIATGAYDSVAKVWDATTGKLLLTLYGATQGINGLTFSLDGTRLITGSDDGNVRTYLLNLEDELALARSRLTRTWRVEECQQYLHVERCP